MRPSFASDNLADYPLAYAEGGGQLALRYAPVGVQATNLSDLTRSQLRVSMSLAASLLLGVPLGAGSALLSHILPISDRITNEVMRIPRTGRVVTVMANIQTRRDNAVPDGVEQAVYRNMLPLIHRPDLPIAGAVGRTRPHVTRANARHPFLRFFRDLFPDPIKDRATTFAAIADVGTLLRAVLPTSIRPVLERLAADTALTDRLLAHSVIVLYLP